MANPPPAPTKIPPIIAVAQFLRLRERGGDTVLCDCRAYLDEREGRDAFALGHIPGARFVDLDTVLAAPPSASAGRHPLPTPEAFAEGMSSTGIGHTTTVIAYDDAGGMIAGRLVWMLRTLGQPAALLDGGIQAWQGDLSTDTVAALPAPHPPRPWPEHAIVDADAVTAAIDADGLVIDSRGAARYRGEHEPIDPVAGHVPGAKNLPFTDNLTNGRFRPIGELQERFDAVDANNDTIYYCGSGVSACHNMLAAEAAGFGRGKLYVGSWSGWSGSGRPHEVGD